MRLADCGQMIPLLQSRARGQETTLASGLEAVFTHADRKRPVDGSRRRLADFVQTITASHPDSDLFAIMQGTDPRDGRIDGRPVYHERLTLHYTLILAVNTHN